MFLSRLPAVGGPLWCGARTRGQSHGAPPARRKRRKIRVCQPGSIFYRADGHARALGLAVTHARPTAPPSELTRRTKSATRGRKNKWFRLWSATTAATSALFPCTCGVVYLGLDVALLAKKSSGAVPVLVFGQLGRRVPLSPFPGLVREVSLLEGVVDRVPCHAVGAASSSERATVSYQRNAG